MKKDIERNLGVQPIEAVMVKHALKAHHLVEASDVPITHKMVSRACKGRRLTLNTKTIVGNALNRATGETYSLTDLFNYE